MAGQIAVTEELLAYVDGISGPEDDIAAELRKLTAELPGGSMLQVPVAEGRFLHFLVRLVGASTVVEVGTYTGYSTLCMARALPAGGRLVTCDINRKMTDIGVAHWARAQVADRVEVRLGDARETLDGLLAEWGRGTVDLVFIDADKRNYPSYYEKAVELVRGGGLIVVDNTLFFGRVVDESADDPDTLAIREVNRIIRDDERVESCVLPLADGITLVRRR